MQSLELVVDNLPLGVDDGLILGDLLNADFGVVFFALELELDVQADDFGIAKDFWLLLKTGIGEGLFESDAVDKKRFLETAAGNLLDAYKLFIKIVLVQGQNGIDHH